VVSNAFNELNGKIPTGSRIAVIGANPNNDNFLTTHKIESKFLNSGKYQVLERSRIGEIIAEIAFSQGPLVDINYALEVGRILSANVVVFGEISTGGNTLSFRAVSVSTGVVIASFTGSFRAN